MKKIIILMIQFYQKCISTDRGILGKLVPNYIGRCTFIPSCSQYAILAIEKHGVFDGLFLSIKRILRCHPWQQEHVDFP
jgi:putative membrane protein insertion efficiency factor